MKNGAGIARARGRVCVTGDVGGVGDGVLVIVGNGGATAAVVVDGGGDDAGGRGTNTALVR